MVGLEPKGRTLYSNDFLYLIIGGQILHGKFSFFVEVPASLYCLRLSRTLGLADEHYCLFMITLDEVIGETHGLGARSIKSTRLVFS